jgi:hypothetical protein
MQSCLYIRGGLGPRSQDQLVLGGGQTKQMCSILRNTHVSRITKAPIFQAVRSNAKKRRRQRANPDLFC